MKFVSWNVNGLRAVVGKGFADIFSSFDADFFCLQEIKLRPGQIDLEFDGYTSHWSYADRPGYSGTAIYTRHEPIRTIHALGVDAHDHEGRITALEYPEWYLVCVYTPNSQNELARLDYRMEWERDFLTFVKELDAHKPVIICGDLNVAHQEIDLANPKTNHNNPGFTDDERNALTRLLNKGFTDTFRALHPDQAKAYSWWSYRFRSREKNIGWRIDYFIISNRLLPRLRKAEIHSDILGSDHCPVSIELE